MITFFEIGGSRLSHVGFNLTETRASGVVVIDTAGDGRLHQAVPAWLRRQFLFAGVGRHENFYSEHFQGHVARLELAVRTLSPDVARALLQRNTTVCYLEPEYLELLFELGGPTRAFMSLPGAAATVREPY